MHHHPLTTPGASVNLASSDVLHETPLMLAASKGNFSIVEILIKNGADYNATQTDGATPLTLCVRSYARYNDPSMVEFINVAHLLIQLGANVDHPAPDGKLCLHMASAIEATALVSLLVTSGANVSLKDKNGKTAFDLLSAFQRLSILADIESSIPLLENHDHALWFVLVQEDGETDAERYQKLTGTVVALVSSHPSLATAKDLHGHVAMVTHYCPI